MAICQKNTLKVRYPKRDGTTVDKTAEVCDSDYAIGQLYVFSPAHCLVVVGTSGNNTVKL